MCWAGWQTSCRHRCAGGRCPRLKLRWAALASRGGVRCVTSRAGRPAGPAQTLMHLSSHATVRKATRNAPLRDVRRQHGCPGQARACMLGRPARCRNLARYAAVRARRAWCAAAPVSAAHRRQQQMATRAASRPG
eukprot:365681-Chlamydomonas_euryale.AAC.1